MRAVCRHFSSAGRKVLLSRGEMRRLSATPWHLCYETEKPEYPWGGQPHDARSKILTYRLWFRHTRNSTRNWSIFRAALKRRPCLAGKVCRYPKFEDEHDQGHACNYNSRPSRSRDHALPNRVRYGRHTI